MKNLLSIFILSFLTLSLSAIQVTFQVDMSEQTPDVAGVHLAGGFGADALPDWDPAGIPLTDLGAGLWSVTLNLTASTSYQYKYVNGNSWGQDEGNIPVPCGVSDNREWTVGVADESIPVHCYQSCSACVVLATPVVTFQVDMSDETVDPLGVHLVGDFSASGYTPSWDPGVLPMNDDGNGIWSLDLTLDESLTYSYKYVNGNAWGQDEAVPAGCESGGNRSWTAGAADESIPLHCFASCNPCAPPATPVVSFQVDMSNETVDPLGVHLVGDFSASGYTPSWDPGVLPMNDDGNGIWSLDLTLDEGLTYSYKYVNGNAWGQDEAVPVGCESGGNRSWTAGAADESIPVHCFASCDPCVVPPPLHQVTFQVEMSLQVVDPTGVYLAGSFNGFSETATPMIDQGAGLWTVDLDLEEGQNYEYKFLNGSTFANEEQVPVGCGVDNGFGAYNRSHTVGLADEVLPAVCYSSCSPCTFVNYNITFQVDMSDETVDPNGVHLLGSFNGYDPSTLAMTDIGGGIWEIVVAITSGQTIEYAFVNGTSLLVQESVDVACSNGMGYREYFVIAAEATLGPVCFGLCGSCPSNQVEVTFQVDLSLAGSNPSGVFIVGSFQSPPFTAGLDLMLDPEMDDIWTYTVLLDPSTVIEYKYLNGPNFANEETVPAGCGVDNGFGGYNRTWTVGSSNETIPLHCFSSCNTCATPPVNVTFQVDMSNEVVDAAGVHIAGSFQGWDPAATLMTDQGAGIWTYTAQIQPSDIVQYKFINGNDWPFAETVPGGCNVGGNREWAVGIADENVPLVCFGSCVICAPPTHLVTFSVDMSLETVDPLGVHIAGDFGSAGLPNWDPAGILMTDAGNGIWTVDLLLNEGVLYEYKYVNGNTFGTDEGFLGGACANGGGNRTWLVGTSDESIPLHCFASCELCPDPVNVTLSVDMSYQTVDLAGVFVAGDFNAWDASATPLLDLGNGIWEVTVLLNANTSFEYKFVNGNDLGTQAEFVPAECQVNGNRSLTTGIADFSMPTICFAECQGCFIDVTFQVDMWNETVPAIGVHLAGSFQGWDPATTPMNYLGYGIWSVTVQVERFTYYEWKFINGNAFGDDEDVPLACAENWNRNMVSGGDSYTLDLVCFGSCTLCDGCLDPFSLEFNPFAEGDNGSCATAVVWGCTYEDASNYDSNANVENGTCLFEVANSCPQDINLDGVVNTGDLNSLLSAYGTFCVVE